MWNLRCRYHKLKYGTDIGLGHMTTPSFDKDAASSVAIKTVVRELLCRISSRRERIKMHQDQLQGLSTGLTISVDNVAGSAAEQRKN